MWLLGLADLKRTTRKVEFAFPKRSCFVNKSTNAGKKGWELKRCAFCSSAM